MTAPILIAVRRIKFCQFGRMWQSQRAAVTNIDGSPLQHGIFVQPSIQPLADLLKHLSCASGLSLSNYWYARGVFVVCLFMRSRLYLAKKNTTNCDRCLFLVRFRLGMCSVPV